MSHPAMICVLGSPDCTGNKGITISMKNSIGAWQESRNACTSTYASSKPGLQNAIPNANPFRSPVNLNSTFTHGEALSGRN